MKRVLVAATVVMTMMYGSEAVPRAQEIPVPAAPQSPPPAAPQRPPIELQRKQIRVMEGVLVQAVRIGAEEVSKVLQRANPTGVTVLMGVPRCRGFILEGYGVFFDVDIPALNQSVVWSVTMLQRDTLVNGALESIKSAIQSMPEGSTRQQAEQGLQRVARQVTPGRALDQTTRDTVTAANMTAANMPRELDPIKEYSEAVKNELIDAMLAHGTPINLGPDEYLTIAARDAEGIGNSGLYDAPTIILRVKGSDLSIYAAEPGRRDEIRKKVDVKVF